MNEKAAGFGIGERAPWGDFPAVIRNGNLGELNREPEYEAGKAGSILNALKLINKLLLDDTLKFIQDHIHGETYLLPVLAIEKSGNNKLPLAMAIVLAEQLELEVEFDIVQCDKIVRTNKGADYRLAFNPSLCRQCKTRCSLYHFG